LVNAGITILTVAEFFSEKDMDGGQSPELLGKATGYRVAELSGGRILLTQVIGWRSILIG
jgi:hypothetical protein